MAGPIKSPGQSLVGAASDRTPSISVRAFAVELSPHHGTAIRYSPSAAEASGLFFDAHCPLSALTAYPPALLRRRSPLAP